MIPERRVCAFRPSAAPARLFIMVFLLSASFMNRWYKKSNSGPDAGWPNSESRRARAWRPEALFKLIRLTPTADQMFGGATACYAPADDRAALKETQDDKTLTHHEST